MIRTDGRGKLIGTFDGRAGSQSHTGVVPLSECAVEVRLDEPRNGASGEDGLVLVLTATLSANAYKIVAPLPESSAEEILEEYDRRRRRGFNRRNVTGGRR